MFLLKKLISQFLMPLPAVAILLLIAIALIARTRRRRLPAVLVAASLAILLVAGNGVVGSSLLKPLEQRYPSYAVAPVGSPAAARPMVDSVDYIVVLGAGHVSDPNVPVTSRVNDSAVVRVAEGVRLYRLHPGAKLIVSGGTVYDPLPSAMHMADLAAALGVPAGDILQADSPKDTKDEARCISPMVGEAPFLLVTSAAHMPRAVALFEHMGANPIPAPTQHLARERHGATPGTFFPSGSGLQKTEYAIHEYVGILWAKLRGQA